MNRRTGARILVIDDEPEILMALRTNLPRHGFQIETASTGQAALDCYTRHRPDILILDLGLPDMSGLDIIRELRTRGNTPIVVLSVRGAERDKVTALDLGADDYVTKPFGIDELLARIRVALRHAARPINGTSAIFRTGHLEVDLEHRIVRVGGNEVHLTPTEYALLKVFVTYPNKVITNRTLLQLVWGPEYWTETHYLHVYVAQLRQKLEVGHQTPRYFVSEPGVGYRLLCDIE